MGANVSTQPHADPPPLPKTTTTSQVPSAGEVKQRDNSNSGADSSKILEKMGKREPAITKDQETRRPVIPVSSSTVSSCSSSSSGNSKATEKSRKTELPNNNNNNMLQLPHKCEDIIRDAHKNVNPTELHAHLHSGIFLNNNEKKYWVESSGHNCFMLFPRSLFITWGEDERFWHWPSIKESSTSGQEVVIEVAELLNVCWLEVHGKLDASYLSPGVKYEVVFVVMLKDHSYGWEVPVNLRLEFPADGTTQQQQQHKVNILQKIKPKSQWVEHHVGEFQTPPSPPPPNNKQENKAEIQFSMFEYEGGQWKRGLVIKGVIIRPKI